MSDLRSPNLKELIDRLFTVRYYQHYVGLAYDDSVQQEHDFFIHICIDPLPGPIRVARRLAMADGRWMPESGYLPLHFLCMLRWSRAFWLLTGKTLARYLRPLCSRRIKGDFRSTYYEVYDISGEKARREIERSCARLRRALASLPEQLPYEAEDCLLMFEFEYLDPPGFIAFLYEHILSFLESALARGKTITWQVFRSPNIPLSHLGE